MEIEKDVSFFSLDGAWLASWELLVPDTVEDDSRYESRGFILAHNVENENRVKVFLKKAVN